MIVTGGVLKGRSLTAPKDLTTRPVTDKTRQAIFNSLGDIDGMIVLDLFAGSGALGIEALSRGATHAVFVDKTSDSIAALNHNIATLKLGELTTALHQDVSKYLTAQARREIFDLIFVDPPYRALNLNVVESATDLLQLNGILVLSSSSKAEIPEHLGELTKIKSKIYGDTKITYFKKSA